MNEKLTNKERKKSIKKFGGILNKYAKPELIPFEKEAWGMAVKEKYNNKI